jgi:malate permease and related proteins
MITYIEFHVIAIAIIKLGLLMALGYALYHFKIINSQFIHSMGLLLIRVIFPCLIIAKTVEHFSFTEYGNVWWLLPLLAMVFGFIGILLGGIGLKFLKNFDSWKEFVCSTGFQNCAYLPMTLIFFAFKGEIQDRLLIYVFLFIIGFNILMWSFVPFFLRKDSHKSFEWKMLINPPVIATIFSLVWVSIFGKNNFPLVIMDPLKQLGQAAFPLSLLTIGGYLSENRAHLPAKKSPIFVALAVKLLILPGIVLAALLSVEMALELKYLLFLEAIMPTAVSLVIIAAYTGADNNFLCSTVFYSHIIAIFSIPLWLEVFYLFNK